MSPNGERTDAERLRDVGARCSARHGPKHLKLSGGEVVKSLASGRGRVELRYEQRQIDVRQDHDAGRGSPERGREFACASPFTPDHARGT